MSLVQVEKFKLCWIVSGKLEVRELEATSTEAGRQYFVLINNPAITSKVLIGPQGNVMECDAEQVLAFLAKAA